MCGEMNNTEKLIKEINDKYLPVINYVLKKNAMYFINIEVANEEDDCQRATDFKIKIKGGDVACRIRFDNAIYSRNKRIYRDLTIRSHTKHNKKTELDKLKEGYAKWYLYIWHKLDKKFDWMVIDIDILRKSGLLDVERKEIDNHDGTKFIAISKEELKENNCIVNENF